ncbi:MAG: hypothetical protein AAF465_13435 [Pseudomonadota bacterium]
MSWAKMITCRILSLSMVTLTVWPLMPASADTSGIVTCDRPDAAHGIIADYLPSIGGQDNPERDPLKLMHFDSYGDISVNRATLVNFVWGNDGLPVLKQPASVVNNVEPFNSNLPVHFLNELDVDVRVQDLVIDTGGGYIAHAFFFRPRSPNRRLIVINMGHGTIDGDPGTSLGHPDALLGQMIRNLGGRGYSVLFVPSPFMPPNQGPVLGGSGPLHTDLHNAMFDAATNPGIDAMRHFMEPITVALNYIELDPDNSPVDITMLGASGGGWTSTAYAALDRRVRTSMQVVGTLPLYLREPPCNNLDQGDGEQMEMGTVLYKDLSYLDLYGLAGVGLNRSHVQYSNVFDTCCFDGLRYRTYIRPLTARISSIGGSYYGTHNSTFCGHGFPSADERLECGYVDDGNYVDTGAQHDTDKWRARNLIPLLEKPNGEPRLNIQTIDNGSTGFSASSGWTGFVRQGFGGDVTVANTSTIETANWTFDVSPDTYKVAVSWTAFSNRNQNATYTVRSGTQTLGSFSVDQTQLPPKTGWYVHDTLFTVPPGSNNLTVELLHDSDKQTIADAVMIWSPTEYIIDNGDPGYSSSPSSSDPSLGWTRFTNSDYLVEGFFDDDVEQAGSLLVKPNATWQFSVPAGNYAVYTTWPAHQNRTDKARYSLVYPGTVAAPMPVIVDQRVVPEDIEDESGKWELLFNSVPPVNGRITIVIENAGTGNLIADAIKLVKL